MNLPFPSKRAPAFADIPDEKWNDWRWQLSHRLNTAEEIEKVIPLTEIGTQSPQRRPALPRGYNPLLYLPDRSG